MPTYPVTHKEHYEPTVSNTYTNTNVVIVCFIAAFQRVPVVLWGHFLEEIPATVKLEAASVNVW